MKGKQKWEMKPGFKYLPERRPAKPEGRLIINGRELTLEETSNYLKANK